MWKVSTHNHLVWLLSRFWREPISLLFFVNIPSIILKPDKYNNILTGNLYFNSLCCHKASCLEPFPECSFGTITVKTLLQHFLFGSESKTAPEVSWRRNWQRYNKELLLAELSKLNLDLTISNVQDHWNYLEQKLVTIADKIAPIVEYTNNETTESSQIPVHIKRKINARKSLLHRLRHMV